jgi:hypothetical protein
MQRVVGKKAVHPAREPLTEAYEVRAFRDEVAHEACPVVNGYPKMSGRESGVPAARCPVNLSFLPAPGTA